MAAAQQVVQHAQAQRPVGDVHAIDVKLIEDTQHDRQAAGQHRNAVRLEAAQLEAIGVLGLDQRALQALQPFARDAVLGALVVEAVELDQLRQRTGGAGRAHRLVPASRAVLLHQHLDLATRRQLGLLHRIIIDIAVRKEVATVRNATDVETLHQLGLVAVADDEFRGPAADVDHQPVALAGRCIVRRPEIDQACLFTARDHLDGETERGLRLDQEFLRILGHAQRIGRYRAHLPGLEVAQAVAEAAQGVDTATARRLVQVFILRKSGRQPDRFAQRIHLEDLAAAVAAGGDRLVDTADHQPEAVGTHVDSSQQTGGGTHGWKTGRMREGIVVLNAGQQNMSLLCPTRDNSNVSQT